MKKEMQKQLKCLLLALSLIFILSSVSADLIITPSPTIIQAKAGSTTNFSVTFQNTYNLTIFDFSFTNLTGFTFTPFNLTTNQTKTINFQISRSDLGFYDINSVASFKYYTDLPVDHQTYQINVTDTGFKPTSLIARQGDTIVWKNTDTITHTVTTSLFDQTLAPNATFQYVFNSPGTYQYQDLVLFYGGSIQIINSTSQEKINNPAYNKNWEVKLTITTDPTNISIVNNNDLYTVNTTGSVDGLLTLTNNGSNVAQQILLTSDPTWITFDSNNFDIPVGQSKYVVYHVQPSILDTNETNITHTVLINIKGANIDNYVKSIQVFIPYTDILNDLNSNEGFLAFFSRYCSQNPNVLFCNNTITSTGNGSVTIQDPLLNLNLSTSQFLNTLKKIQSISDTVDRVGNDVKQSDDTNNQRFLAIDDKLNRTLTIVQKNQDESSTRSVVLWIIGTVVVIIICILLVGLTRKKYNSKRNLTEEGLMQVIEEQ